MTDWQNHIYIKSRYYWKQVLLICFSFVVQNERLVAETIEDRRFLLRLVVHAADIRLSPPLFQFKEKTLNIQFPFAHSWICSWGSAMTKPPSVSLMWSELVLEEFFRLLVAASWRYLRLYGRQGDEERKAGIPITAYFDRWYFFPCAQDPSLHFCFDSLKFSYFSLFGISERTQQWVNVRFMCYVNLICELWICPRKIYHLFPRNNIHIYINMYIYI